MISQRQIQTLLISVNLILLVIIKENAQKKIVLVYKQEATAKNFVFVPLSNVNMHIKDVTVQIDAIKFHQLPQNRNVDAYEKKENVIQIFVKDAKTVLIAII